MDTDHIWIFKTAYFSFDSIKTYDLSILLTTNSQDNLNLRMPGIIHRCSLNKNSDKKYNLTTKHCAILCEMPLSGSSHKYTDNDIIDVLYVLIDNGIDGHTDGY